jgi:DNA-binding NtrC family response regulator
MSDTLQSTLLLIDDDVEALGLLGARLRGGCAGKEIYTASSSQSALRVQERNRPDVAVVDLCLAPEGGVCAGFELIRRLREQDPSMRIIVLTGYAAFDHGVRAITLGAASFLEKPADIAHLTALIKDCGVQAALRREVEKLRQFESARQLPGLVGASPVFKALLEEVRFAAAGNQPVLICGETGSGKGVIAGAIHALGQRASAPLVRYQANFSGGDLVSSDLFGHRRGAFTGAGEDRCGMIESADGGTLFLDEVDELPTETQISLLGVLQERTFRRLGASEERSSDFRLLSATNRNLDDSLRSGKIRHDFFHRIAHLVIQVPPLRDRINDIEALAEHFLACVRERENLPVARIDSEALARLQEYDWPGNVRELQAVIESAAYRACFKERPVIVASDLRRNFSGKSRGSEQGGGFHEKVSLFRRQLVREALLAHQGNQVQAAKKLGIDRSSLRRILEEN